MKVLIFAGGIGSRLGEETSIIPKPMIKIGEYPILWHIMKIYSYYGFNDFIVLTGYKQECIKNYFLNYHSINSDLTILLTMKDSFDEAYYDIDELESMVDTELSKFNSTLASDPLVGITKESVESDGGNSIIKLKFENYFDLNAYYANYINKKKTFTMFVGSYDESVNAGITINSTIYNNDEEKAAMNLEEIPTSGYVIFYINSGETVEFADTIVGVSESVTVSGNQVTTTNGVDNYVILQPANVTANTDETESVDMETTVTDTTTVAQ